MKLKVAANISLSSQTKEKGEYSGAEQISKPQIHNQEKYGGGKRLDAPICLSLPGLLGERHTYAFR